MAALEWNADLYLPLVAYQAQAGPGLVQNSSARTTASLSLSFSNDRTDPLCCRTHRCSSEIRRSARCRFRTEIVSTKPASASSRRIACEETRLERIKKFSWWILVKRLPWIYTHTTRRKTAQSTARPREGGQWWRVDEESLGMATRLGTRNSEVNALEQRGYLIGKKIGQVVYSSLYSSVCLI